MFYYERYANHDKSARLGKQLRPVIEKKIQMLHEIKNYPIGELKFLSEALVSTIKCRNVLKWTYAYGYYLDKDVPEAKKDLNHKDQFEFWQTKLEEMTDYLHEMVETNLDCYLDPNITDRTPFYKFKGKLVSFSEATTQYYTNLVGGLEEYRLAKESYS